MVFKLCTFVLLFLASEGSAALFFGGEKTSYSVVRTRGQQGRRIYVIDPKTKRAQLVKSRVRTQGGRDTLRYEGCEQALGSILGSPEVNRSQLTLTAIDNDGVEYDLALSNTKADEALLDLLLLGSISAESPFQLYQRGIHSFDPGDMGHTDLLNFLLHPSNEPDTIPRHSYHSGGFVSQLVIKRERKVPNIVRFQRGGDWQYGTVVKRRSKKSLLAYYDGDQIRMEWKNHKDYESTLFRFGNSNPLVLSIQNRVAELERDPTHRWHGLTPFVPGTTLRSDDFISLFQLRSESTEHRIEGYSPKMVEGILNLPADLKFPELLGQVVEVRKKATPNTVFHGTDLGAPRNGNTAITRLHYGTGTFEAAVSFVSSSRGKFVASTYLHGELVNIQRLVEQGVELTGYDTQHGEFVAPTGEMVERGLKIMEQLYDSILAKEYTSLRELQRDVAKIHWWGDQLTPYKRGSAGIMEGLTKYIFLQKGYIPSPWKNDVIPYATAMTHTLSEYVDLYPDMFQD